MFRTDDLPAALQSRTQETSDGCWMWLGAKNDQGYGQVRIQGRLWYVHRLSFENMIAPIPTGLQLDHLCFNRGCLNPGRHNGQTIWGGYFNSVEEAAMSAAALRARHFTHAGMA